jgi:hypothetical protein
MKPVANPPVAGGVESVKRHLGRADEIDGHGERRDQRRDLEGPKSSEMMRA